MADEKGAELIPNVEVPSEELEEKSDLELLTPPEESEEVEEVAEEEEEEPEEKPEGVLRPTFKDVTAKYPELFKDFPGLRDAFFREKEFSKVFPSIEDAKDASERADDYDYLEGLITAGGRGELKEFFDVIGKTDVETLQKMAGNFLPSLFEANADLYYNVTTPIISNVLKAAEREGATRGDENLKNAALHIANFIFGPKGLEGVPKVEGHDEKLKGEREKFYEERFAISQREIYDSGKDKLLASIKAEVDPEGAFDSYTVDKMAQDIFDGIGKSLEADSDHMNRMNNLWSRAARAGFTGDWKARIVSAYLARAKSLIPPVRSKVREKVLKDRKTSEETRKQKAESTNKRELGVSSPAGLKSSVVDSKRVDYRKTSDMDLILGKVTLKK